MKVLITGSNGQLAKQIAKDCPRIIDNDLVKIFETSKKDLDISINKDCQEIISNIKPDWVINCAAYTNVEKAEIEKDIAEKVNIIGPINLAKSIKKINGKIIHISTDYVFNGEKRKPYNTYDKKSPINFYGYTKSEGEDNVLEILNNNAFIVRTGWLYGPIGKNFLLTMLKLHNQKSKNNQHIDVVNDQIGSPTSTCSLSSACWEIIKRDNYLLPKILHWSDIGEISWYDFAVSIKKYAKLNNLINDFAIIKSIKSDQINMQAKRPKYSVLDLSESCKSLDLYPNNYENQLDKIVKIIKNR
tara:strand:- start:4652 stop:5554 length:903 start_codon:yes stop_codon:yes gene_type:complete